MLSWIKMRTDLRQDPAVMQLSNLLRLPRDHVVGLLHRFWSWADGQTADGRIPFVSFDDVDDEVGHKGFAAALKEVGWLKKVTEEPGGGILIPNFERHNGESAKRRATDSERKRQDRSSGKSPGKVGRWSAGSPPRNGPEKIREDKRREEESREEYLPPRNTHMAENRSPGRPGGRPVGQGHLSFGELWRWVPNKVKKKRAEQYWNRMSVPDRERASEAYPKHAALYTRYQVARQYIPQLASWLSGARWEDDLEAVEAELKSRMERERG